MSLTVKKLNVKLQKDAILREVSLDIQDGEFVALLGASGCGKSTLLKSIAGLLPIESGEITIDGLSLQNIAPENRGAVIVFQDLRLFPHMTVEKNIAFAMELKKIPKEIQKETVRRLLKDVQLSGYEDRKIREMSGGQLQRIALARALAANPRILLLDEPFSGLDEKLRMEMGVLVKKLHRERKLTTILVTHDKREALQMSDRIALMNEGEILQYDTPKGIFCTPVSRKAADYFGKANYINGIVENGEFVCGLGRFRTVEEPGNYTAMVRPFALKLSAAGTGGIVREIVFKGETFEYLLETSEGMLTSESVCAEPELLSMQPGSSVGIKVNPEAVVYFRTQEEEE